MWRTRAVAFAMIIVVMFTASLSPASAGQPYELEPELFDLEMAQANLDQLRADAAMLRNELADILDQIDGLTIERDFIELNDQERNDVMQQSRTRARNMAINAYIGIGPPLSGLFVLDAASANELSFRNSLLRQQAERLHEAAETYSVLAGEADASVLELADSINDEIRQAEAVSRALGRIRDQIPHAEWLVHIASIHHDGDLAFVESGRGEPTAEEWRQLRSCESTETYNIDTGNMFFGAYQFTWETWGTVGGSGNPADAHPAEQDARARWLYATRGSQPWPICGRYLP